MVSFDPAVFLHPAEYHTTETQLLPVALFGLGFGLIAFGIRRLRTVAVEKAADAGTER